MSTYRVRVIDRALAALELLGSKETALTLAELSRELGLPKSTLLRLLAVLELHGFVTKNTRDGSYYLGLKLYELGNKAASQVDLRERARPCLSRIVSMIGETAYLCVLHGTSALVLERVEPERMLRVPTDIGQGFLHNLHASAVGKILLASLSDSEARKTLMGAKLTRHTRNTVTSLSQMMSELRRIRERGYALDNEEAEEGLLCIATPVRDHSGKVIASVGVAGPTFRLRKFKPSILASLLAKESDKLSAALGFRPMGISGTDIAQPAKPPLSPTRAPKHDPSPDYRRPPTASKALPSENSL